MGRKPATVAAADTAAAAAAVVPTADLRLRTKAGFSMDIVLKTWANAKLTHQHTHPFGINDSFNQSFFNRKERGKRHTHIYAHAHMIVCAFDFIYL